MDNTLTYCYLSIVETICARGYLVKFLSPYSPEFNPIELSFSVLKAWVRRRFDLMWPRFESSFGNWLLISVQQSQCNRFAEAHFRHSGIRGYIFAAGCFS